MVKGSRHNHTVQFRALYPRTGGGEDIDFIFQMKKFYSEDNCVVSVPGACAQNPWWNNGSTCCRQIYGWAIGDSLCLNEWDDKIYHIFPIWTECLLLEFVVSLALHLINLSIHRLIKAALFITLFNHCTKAFAYFPRVFQTKRSNQGLFMSLY